MNMDDIKVCLICEKLVFNDDACICSSNRDSRPVNKLPKASLYEKNKSAVYATGNKWAIENFNDVNKRY